MEVDHELQGDEDRRAVHALVAAGGNEWRKEPHHRVYFNARRQRELLGLEITYFGPAKRGTAREIREAHLGGIKISPHEARALHQRFEDGKLWFDVVAGAWRYSGMPQELGEQMIAALQRRLEAAEARA